MITAIIPTYRNPEYLDLCLRSAIENKVHDETEIIVIVDGHYDESQDIVEKYDGISVLDLPENRGMQSAINMGVWNATTEWIFVVNDDNVFGPEWDRRLRDICTGSGYGTEEFDCVYTINQVEPVSSIFDFIVKDFGRTAAEFRYDDWIRDEPEISSDGSSSAGKIFPFLMTKRWFMAVGGFDTVYDSPFWCDVDFWLKLEMTGLVDCSRSYKAHLYHFGSMATKNRTDDESEIFRKSEMGAAEMFKYKWGFVPDIVANTKRNNTKFPLECSSTQRGITFTYNSMRGEVN